MKINFDLNKLGPIQKKRWRIVYHEIGHVVAYVHYNYQFDYVTVVPNGSLAGHLKSPDLDESNLSDQQLEMCSVILLAGEAIDRRLFGCHTWYHCGAKHDFQELYRLHKRKYQPHFFLQERFQSVNYFFSLCKKVCGILNQYEKEIHLLAYELKKRKTLTYGEVCEALKGVDRTRITFKAIVSEREWREMSHEIDDLIF